MKAVFDKQKLLEALIAAAGISQTKNTLVHVDGLLFECPPNARYGEYDVDDMTVCRISAFDLEKGIRITVPCRVIEKGMYVINTSKILQIVRAMPDGDVTLDIDERGRVSVDGGYSHFEISAEPGEDFPTMPKIVGDRQYKLPQYGVRNLINQTIFAVAQNDQRPAFNGAMFKIQNGILGVIGCDGNRLAAAQWNLADINPDVPDANIIIPGRFLTELAKLLSDTEEETVMIIGHKTVIFKVDNIYVFSRMIDAEFTKYEKFLPQTYMTEVFLSRSELLGAIERASLVSEDKLGGNTRAHAKLEFHDKTVAVSSVSSIVSVYEEIPAAIEGAPVDIGFNCRYLLDALSACPKGCDRLRIRLNSPLMGVIFEPTEGSAFHTARPAESVFGERAHDLEPDDDLKKKDSFMYFIMPVRMNK